MKIMTTSAFATALILIGVTLLVLGSIPMKNTIEGNTLTVHFVIGKKVIDLTGANFLPVPDDVDRRQEEIRPFQEHQDQEQVHIIPYR